MNVKPTQGIWNYIEARIDDLFKDRLRDAGDWYSYGHTLEEIRTDVMRQVMTPEEVEHVEALGSKFFPTQHDSISVRIMFGEREEALTIPLSPAVRYPGHWAGWDRTSKPQIREGLLPNIAQLRHDAVGRINTDKKDFLEPLETAYKNTPSINALLKAWPALADLLPPETIEKVNKKVERKKIEAAVDVYEAKALSVHLLKAKVAQ